MEAVRRLVAGELVAIPTETVYGLAARIDRPESVAAVFAAKGRPSFNPLIVHAPNLRAALALTVRPSPLARRLAELFWPGPLTLVLEKTDAVPALVTAGQPTVALRVPSHPLARKILERVRVPLAAPSANRSTHLSPTTAEHVLRSLGEHTKVLDGGTATHGLESTVVRVAGQSVEVLRLGSLSVDTLRAVAPVTVVTSTDGHPSPGMSLRHYAPRVPLALVASAEGHGGPGVALVTLKPHGAAASYARAEVLSPSGDLVAAAARLFDVLHSLESDPAVDRIVAVPVPEEGLGLAINDRLRRGARTAP